MKDEDLIKSKKNALDQAIKDIRNTCGKESISTFQELAKHKNIPSISTGSLLLDNALGIGGIPRGRIVEIYGNEGSGKTTIALHAIANAQKHNGLCAFIDAEHALDPVYAKKIGVKLDDLVISQPDHGEQAFEIVEKLARSGAVDLIVVDSVAALVPKSELEGDMEDSVMGSHARLMSKAMRKIVSCLFKSDTAIIFINQVRMKIGVMFGNPETTTGGNALKFYASLRMEVRKKGLLKKDDGVIGQEIEVKICKNKLFPPFKKVDLELIYGVGINRNSELVDLCVEMNIIQKSGSWFAYGDKKLGQGKDSVVSLIAKDEKLYNELLAKTKVTVNQVITEKTEES